tara:strand:- start:1126 stop:1500 length:375 start_codon:yes stop_codon:yes gene_type:complete
METATYKQALENELAELTQSLSELGVQNPHNQNDWVTVPDEPAKNTADPNDFGDRSEEWQERRGTLSALETRFNNIKRALHKIEEGSYGTCEIGGEQIETDRLNANAAARTCKVHLEDEAQLPM